MTDRDEDALRVAAREIAPDTPAYRLDVTDHAAGTNPYYQPGK